MSVSEEEQRESRYHIRVEDFSLRDNIRLMEYEILRD